MTTHWFVHDSGNMAAWPGPSIFTTMLDQGAWSRFPFFRTVRRPRRPRGA